MLGGAALWLIPDPTLLTKIGGGALIGHGADMAAASWNQMWTGQTTQTFTAQGVSKGLQSVGVPSPYASMVGGLSEIGLAAVPIAIVAKVGTAGRVGVKALHRVPALTAADVAEKATVGSGHIGVDRIMLPRTTTLGPVSTTRELLVTGAIPGIEGVILNQRTVLFSDIWAMSQKAGVEFALTKEVGLYVLRSGSFTSVAIPRGIRPIVHTHPTDMMGINSLLPSKTDINMLNYLWSLNPGGPRPVSQIITGPSNTTIFRATGLEPW